jgi:hypothetical protein
VGKGLQVMDRPVVILRIGVVVVLENWATNTNTFWPRCRCAYVRCRIAVGLSA